MRVHSCLQHSRQIRLQGHRRRAPRRLHLRHQCLRRLQCPRLLRRRHIPRTSRCWGESHDSTLSMPVAMPVMILLPLASAFVRLTDSQRSDRTQSKPDPVPSPLGRDKRAAIQGFIDGRCVRPSQLPLRCVCQVGDAESPPWSCIKSDGTRQDRWSASIMNAQLPYLLTGHEGIGPFDSGIIISPAVADAAVRCAYSEVASVPDNHF